MFKFILYVPGSCQNVSLSQYLVCYSPALATQWLYSICKAALAIQWLCKTKPLDYKATIKAITCTYKSLHQLETTVYSLHVKRSLWDIKMRSQNKRSFASDPIPRKTEPNASCHSNLNTLLWSWKTVSKPKPSTKRKHSFSSDNDVLISHVVGFCVAVHHKTNNWGELGGCKTLALGAVVPTKRLCKGLPRMA